MQVFYMFSKNPVEITREKKLSVEEISDALRIAIATEIFQFYIRSSFICRDPFVGLPVRG
jgi:hypothetical protein